MLAALAVVVLVNRERVRVGERPLAVSPALVRRAREHRGTAELRTSGCLGECGDNIAWGEPDLSPAGAVKLWMSSPGHRANILDPAYRWTGVATFRWRGLAVYVQEFAAHRRRDA